eukprot:3202677-Rhodomonas_salina.2
MLLRAFALECAALVLACLVLHTCDVLRGADFSLSPSLLSPPSPLSRSLSLSLALSRSSRTGTATTRTGPARRTWRWCKEQKRTDARDTGGEKPAAARSARRGGGGLEKVGLGRIILGSWWQWEGGLVARVYAAGVDADMMRGNPRQSFCCDKGYWSIASLRAAPHSASPLRRVTGPAVCVQTFASCDTGLGMLLQTRTEAATKDSRTGVQSQRSGTQIVPRMWCAAVKI